MDKKITRNTDKEIGKIYETTDYAKFVCYDWNRNAEIDDYASKKLTRSVMENGWKQEPIIVDENMGIIDGQHRWLFASKNGLTLYYMVMPGLTKEDCQIMNSVRTSWKNLDYIRFFAMQGNSSYQKVLALTECYQNVPLMVIMYSLTSLTEGGSEHYTISSGNFVCSNEEYENAKEVLDKVTILMPYISKIKGRKTQAIQGIIWCLRNEPVDFDRFARRLSETCNEMVVTSLDHALKLFEEIYNRQLTKTNRISFAFDYKQSKLKDKEIA